MKHLLLISILLLLAICLAPLWGEQIPPQKAMPAPSVIKQPPKSTIKKTPLEVRVRVLERKVETLEKQVKILLFDNRETTLDIEALKRGQIRERRQLQKLRNEKSTSPSPESEFYGSPKPKRRRRTGPVVEKK